MKTILPGLVTAAILLTSVIPSFAVVDQKLEIQGTNLVLSWPSSGTEYFLVQHRTTLDASTPWTTLTNNYPANSTNRTTLVIPCCDLPPFSFPVAGGGTNSGGGEPPSPGSSMAMSQSSEPESSTELWATQDSGVAVPFILFPPGIDTSDLTIFEVEKSETQSQSKSQSFSLSEAESFDGESNEPMNLSSGGCDCPSMGFFRVMLVPDFYYDYSQYQFSYGSEFMPIYLGVDGQAVPNAQLLVNGEVFPYARYSLEQYDFGTPGNPNVQSTYGIWFFSDRLTNGTYQLQLRTTLQLNNQLNADTPFLTMTNPAFSTTVNNPIVFKKWNNLLVGTNHTFQAQTEIYPATWEIEVFDAYGQWVTGQTGTTTNGEISWTWDLYDDLGNLRDNVEADPYFDPYVSVSSTGGISASATVQRPAPLSSLDYPYVGGWNVAYQDKDKFVPNARDKIIQAWLAVRGGPSLKGIPNAGILLKYGRPNEVDMPADPLQAMNARNASWDNLKSHLLQPLFRNFYYLGHGSDFVLGGDWDKMTNDVALGKIYPIGSESDPNVYQDGTETVRSRAFLSSGWCYLLSPISGEDPHPYRFVFLDGCSTATGDWPVPFGMQATTNTIEYYQDTNRFPYVRPYAFVGWNTLTYYSSPLNSTYTDKDGNQWGNYQKYADFRSQWMALWSHGAQFPKLDAALEEARRTSGWIPPATYNNTIRIYGLRDIEFNEYNQRANWPITP